MMTAIRKKVSRGVLWYKSGETDNIFRRESDDLNTDESFDK